MNLRKTEKEVAGIVTRMYESPDLIQYPYHNLAHTESVVGHVKEIAAWYLLNETDTFILSMSAWFHDIGHLYGEIKGHEERGVVIMQHCLHNIAGDLITAISQCILATRFPTHPTTLREQIICDADTYHAGTPLFRQTDVLVEKEMEMRTGTTFPDWHRKSLHFLQQHVFYTEYCRTRLNEGKQQNIDWLITQIDR